MIAEDLRTARIVIQDLGMMGERKQVPATILYAFDANGKKLQLSPRDFGAGHQERLGSQIRAIGAPPPTQFIAIPQRLMSADQVLNDISKERRTLTFRLRLAKISLMRFVKRGERKIDRWIWRAKIELGKLHTRYRDFRRGIELEDSWSYDLTEIAESPPNFQPKARRPSVV